jgi:hypothetical protein
MPYSFTKKELIDAMSDLDDDAPIEINIITKSSDGVEEGELYEIEAFAMSGTVEGMVVGYACEKGEM